MAFQIPDGVPIPVDPADSAQADFAKVAASYGLSPAGTNLTSGGGVQAALASMQPPAPSDSAPRAELVSQSNTAPRAELVSQPDVSGLPADLAKAIGPVRFKPSTGEGLKPITGRAELAPGDLADIAKFQADQLATEMNRAGTPLTVGEYKAHLANFYAGAMKLNLGIQPEKLPADQADKLAALHDGLKIVDNIHEAQKVLVTKYPGLIQGLPITYPMQQSDEYKAYQTAVQLGSAQLARGVGGQTGVLTDNDIKIVKDALPNEHDTPTQARIKADILKKQSLDMMESKAKYLHASHYDVSEALPMIQEDRQKFLDSPSQKDERQAEADRVALDVQQKAAQQQAQADRANRVARPTPLPPPSQQQTPAPTPVPEVTQAQPQQYQPATDQSVGQNQPLFGL